MTTGYAVRKDLLGARGVEMESEVGEDEFFSIDCPVFSGPGSAPSSADVDDERDRRIDGGIYFNNVAFQSRATDRENIAGAAQLGFMAIVGGAQPSDLRWSDPDEDFVWIASDNSLVLMDAQTIVEFGKSAAAQKQALIFAARAIKDMQPIPVDFTDNKWWP